MKKIAITGATSGIGLVAAQTLHQQGNKVFLLVRNIEKAQKIIQSWANPDSVEIIECDLANLASVRKASELLISKTDQLDVLINNAGGIFQHRELSNDGFEMHFAMNHLGHFLLTRLIIDLLKPTARIINVSSEAHRAGKLDFNDLQLAKSFGSLKGYANAKLCNVYFTTQLHERYFQQGISSFSLHPGVVRTAFAAESKGFIGWLFRTAQPFMISAEKGAATTLYLATAPYIEKHSGGYFKKKKPVKLSAIALRHDLAKQLWNESEKLVKDFI